MKAIIVGGGPVGLVMAHALHHIGVDFVLLESRDSAVVDAGSNLVILPMAMRPLYQLGLEDALLKNTVPLGDFERFDHYGRDIGKFHFAEFLEKL